MDRKELQETGLLAGQRRLENLALVISDPVTMDVISQRVAEGEPLKEIADAWNVPYGRLAKWIATDPHRLAEFEAALATWADAEAQSCIGIADDADPDDIAHAKLRIDTRLRLAEKWNRKRYGQKGEAGGDVGGLTIVIQQLDGTLTPVESKFEFESKVIATPVDISFVDVPEIKHE